MNVVANEVVKFREEQVRTLHWTLKNKVSNFIHLNGAGCTGKKTVAQFVCNQLSNQVQEVVYIDCADSDGDERLMCHQLAQTFNSDLLHSDVDSVCCSLEDRLNVMSADSKQFVLIINKPDLMNMASSMLHTFVQLTEKLPCFVLITVSQLPLHAFLQYNHLRHQPPLIMRFANYEKTELVSLLADEVTCFMEDWPEYAIIEDEEDITNLIQFYCQQIISTCSVVTRNLIELRTVAISNWAAFVQPITLPEDDPQGVNPSDKMKLWNHFRHILQPAMRRGLFVNASDVHVKQADMPGAHKLLLTACYLASYNPPKYDRRFFVKCSFQRKSSKAAPTEQRQQLHVRGPQAFTMNRAWHIAIALARENTTLDRHTMLSVVQTLQSLVENGFVKRVSAAGNLDVPKYRCVIDLDTIASISRSLEINIKQYLADFN